MAGGSVQDGVGFSSPLFTQVVRLGPGESVGFASQQRICNLVGNEESSPLSSFVVDRAKNRMRAKNTLAFCLWSALSGRSQCSRESHRSFTSQAGCVAGRSWPAGKMHSRRRGRALPGGQRVSLDWFLHTHVSSFHLLAVSRARHHLLLCLLPCLTPTVGAKPEIRKIQYMVGGWLLNLHTRQKAKGK